MPTPETLSLLQKLSIELKIRGFSKKTVETYLYHNKKALEALKKAPEAVTEEDIKSHLAFLLTDQKISPATIALKKAALKFFYAEILKKNIVTLKTPKIPKHVPVVLTKEEVKRLIEAAVGSKSRLILQLLYSSGLRLSELLNLKVNDLELKEKILSAFLCHR